MKQFYSIGIDKLTLCYNIVDNSILHSINNEEEIDMGYFRLKRIKSGHFRNSFLILSLWDAPDLNGLTWQVYGVLKFARYTDNEEKGIMAWIYFDNHTLYKQVYPDVSSIIYAEYISEHLGLELRNITEIEIYFDTNSNAPKYIKKILKDDSIKTILNGNIVDRKINVKEIRYLHTGTLDVYKDMTIYVKQADSKGFRMKAYNKKKEIAESSHKTYIMEWHQLTPSKKLYRLELSLKHRHLKEYIMNNGIVLTHNLFTDREFLFDCFLHFADRLLRFEDKKKNHFSVLQVL